MPSPFERLDREPQDRRAPSSEARHISHKPPEPESPEASLQRLHREVASLRSEFYRLQAELQRVEAAIRAGTSIRRKEDLRIPDLSEEISSQDLDDWLSRQGDPRTYHSRVKDRLAFVRGQYGATEDDLHQLRHAPRSWTIDENSST